MRPFVQPPVWFCNTTFTFISDPLESRFPANSVHFLLQFCKQDLTVADWVTHRHRFWVSSCRWNPCASPKSTGCVVRGCCKGSCPSADGRGRNCCMSMSYKLRQT